MYLTFERYALLGGGVSEDAFPPLSKQAEALLNEWTLGRFNTWKAEDELVELALMIIVDDLSQSGGRELTSFSNGVDSFGFAGGQGAYGSLYDRVTAFLPTELVSLSCE